LYQCFAALAPFVDALWLVAPQAVELNGSVGLIISDGGHIQGVHAPEPSHVLAQAFSNLEATLLFISDGINCRWLVCCVI